MYVRIWAPTRSQHLGDGHKAIRHIREHLECAERRCCVECPTTHPGTAGRTVLEEHTDDGNHCEAAVHRLHGQLLLLLGRIRRGQDLEDKVALRGRCARGLVHGDLAESHVLEDLAPAVQEEHADDGHHCEAAARRPRCTLHLPQSRTRGGQALKP